MEENWRESAVELFLESYKEILYVLPHAKRWDPTNPERASSLTMERIDVWPLDDDVTSKFVCTNVNNVSGFPDVKTIVQQQFESALKALNNTDFMR